MTGPTAAGPGMVMLAEPLQACIDAAKRAAEGGRRGSAAGAC